MCQKTPSKNLAQYSLCNTTCKGTILNTLIFYLSWMSSEHSSYFQLLLPCIPEKLTTNPQHMSAEREISFVYQSQWRGWLNKRFTLCTFFTEHRYKAHIYWVALHYLVQLGIHQKKMNSINVKVCNNILSSPKGKISNWWEWLSHLPSTRYAESTHSTCTINILEHYLGTSNTTKYFKQLHMLSLHI